MIKYSKEKFRKARHKMKSEGKFEENDIREKGNPVIWLKNQENTDLTS